MRLIIKKGDMMAKTPNKKTQKVIKEARKNTKEFHISRDLVMIKIDNFDEEIIHNFKEGLNEIKLINQGELKARPIKEFLDEL